MQMLKKALATLALLLFAHAQAQVGAQIDYSVTSLGGSSWRYDYTVRNVGTAAFDEVTIYFDRASFANLVLLSSPGGWDVLLAAPDAAIPANGFLDALASSSFAGGSSVSGFSVSVNFVGVGTPPSQPFDIVEPGTFAVLASGVTSAVPEPARDALMAAGLFLLWYLRRQRR